MWSREATVPPIVLGPEARSAARRRLLLTWALGTGRSHDNGSMTRGPGRKHSGANRPASLPSMRAPISRSGCTTRAMGRRTRESSPVSTAKILPGEQPGEEPGRGARVLRVQRTARLGKTPQPDSLHVDPVRTLRELHAE